MRHARFRIVPATNPIRIRVMYDPESQYIESELPDGSDPGGVFTTLLLDALQIEIDDEGRAQYVWGFCSHEFWELARLQPPSSRPGALTADVGKDLEPGISHGVPAEGGWPVHFDPRESWLCVGETRLPESGVAVEFATGCIAVVEDDTLIALWLHLSPLPSQVLRDLIQGVPGSDRPMPSESEVEEKLVALLEKRITAEETAAWARSQPLPHSAPEPFGRILGELSLVDTPMYGEAELRRLLSELREGS